VLHEAAHAVIDQRKYWHLHRTMLASHGPEFARLYLDLLADYAGVSKSEARHLGVIQKPRRVRFATRARMEELGIVPKGPTYYKAKKIVDRAEREREAKKKAPTRMAAGRRCTELERIFNSVL
jgi:hypothetical protein